MEITSAVIDPMAHRTVQYHSDIGRYTWMCRVLITSGHRNLLL
jgi:hypothetical protein